MKKTIILAVMTVVAAASFILSPAFAQNMMNKLDLTGDQRAKMELKDAEIDRQIQPLKQEINELRTELNKEMMSQKPDQTKINDLIEKVSADMSEIQKKKVSFMIWMRGQLTPEQNQKLMLMMQNRQQDNKEENEK